MELRPITKEDNTYANGFAQSRIGGRAENQDSYDFREFDRGYVVTVCDGMGGGPGGKTASSIAVREIIEGITSGSPEEGMSSIVIKAIRRANTAILDTARENPELRGMGSTATVLVLTDYAAVVAHVGDSRIYQFRGTSKVFRTFDHSLVFELVKSGQITEEQARLSADSNVITRGLGIKDDVEVEVVEIPYEKGDRFMLCSDGIHGSMPETQLIRMATRRDKPLGIVTDEIATAVDNIGNNTGGRHDNLTLALVETRINSQLKHTMNKQTKYTLLGLAGLLVLSVIINIALLSRPHGDTLAKQALIECQHSDSVKDSTITKLRESIAALTDTIFDLRQKQGNQ